MKASTKLRRHFINDADLEVKVAQILHLIRRAFAYMEKRIDPPSSMHQLNAQAVTKHCQLGEVWSIGDPVIACMFLKLKPDALYLGRLAVSTEARGNGLSHLLVAHAEQRAQHYERSILEINTRIELVENHALFLKLGFLKTAEGTHSGFQKPTYIVMQKQIQAPIHCS